jgi:hypothetical protein
VTRPFGLGDVSLLWALRRRGLALDMQRAMLWPTSPLHTALAELLPTRHLSPTRTYVCETEGSDERGFLQVLTCPERREWQVIHLAPWTGSGDLESCEGWVGPLVELCGLAGAWGAWRIRAGVAAGGPEEEAFRQAGFIPYTREEVYRLRGPQPVPGTEDLLRPICAQDGWALSQLVNRVVPSHVQHAEGLNLSSSSGPLLTRLGVSHEQGYVWPRGDDLAAYVGLSRGRDGAWVRVLLDPDARKQAGDLLGSLMARVLPTADLYCAVREYQAGLRSTLVAMGFELFAVQVWLVKHTARPAECRPFRHLVALDKRTEPVTTPLHPVHSASGRPWATREHCVYEYRRTDSFAVGPD